MSVTLDNTPPETAALATLDGPDRPSALIRFGDALYIGTAPAGPEGRARILRLGWPDGAAPETVHEGGLGSAVTGFAVFAGQGDSSPALYATLAAPEGGLVLHSRDGAAFGAVSEPGLGEAANSWLGPLTVAGDRLVVAAGSASPLSPETTGARLLASAGPLEAPWEALAEPGFGDPENTAISALLATPAGLVAGTANTVRGFQLWQQGAEGGWTQRLGDGAARYSLNTGLTALAVGDGELLLGTGTAPEPEEGGLDEAVPPELIALDEAGGWETLVGEPRFSPAGFKVPFALMGAGFGIKETAVVTAILTGPGGALTVITTAVPAAGTRPFGLAEAGKSRIWHSTDGAESFAERPAPGPVLAALATDKGACLAVQTEGGAALHLAPLG